MAGVQKKMVRGHLVYRGGFGVYIHPLFAERHKIPWGVEIHPSVMDRHSKEVPPMNYDTSHIWRLED
jgi:hypothetical protein